MVTAALVTFFILLLGILLIWFSRRLHRSTGLPAGEIVYSDTSDWQKQQEPIISRKFGIVGKPDYLMMIKERRRELHIPIEVKSRKRPQEPYDSHILQLGAYCLMVEDVYKARPPYGLLHYADDTLKIPFTNALRSQVLAATEAIRRSRSSSDVSRQHNDWGKCRGCGYQRACGEEALL